MNEDMNKPVVITPLFSAEASRIIEKLWQLAYMNITEGELKKKIIEAKVYKATIDFQPVGIIILTAKPLTEMAVYLSDAAPKEKWAEAINKIASLAFSAPEVYKIKWPITESNKEMITVAQGCGFKEEGKLQEEGPNREPLISFALSRNGNQPKPCFEQSSPTSGTGENPMVELKTAIRQLEKENTDLKILAGEKIQQIAEQTKIITELQKKETTQNLSPEISDLQEILSLRKEIGERDKQKNKYKEWLEKKNKMLAEAQEKIALLEAELRKQVQKPEEISIACDEKPAEITSKRQVDSPVEEDPKKSLADKELNDVQLKVLKLVIVNGESGITQQKIIKETGISQTNVSLAIRTLNAKGLIENRKEGRQSRAIAIMEQIEEQFPDLLQQASEISKAEIQEPPQPPEAKPEPNETTKAEPIPLSNFLTDEESNLLESLPEHKKLQISDYINDCLYERQTISLSVICGKAGVKKDQSQLFVSAIVKSMNKATINSNDQMEAVKISIDEDNFEKSVIELLNKSTLKSIIPDIDKQPPNVEEICNSNGFGQTQREILLALKEAGGILNAGGLRSKVGINKELFKSYLLDMQTHKIISFENNSIKLTI